MRSDSLTPAGFSIPPEVYDLKKKAVEIFTNLARLAEEEVRKAEEDEDCWDPLDYMISLFEKIVGSSFNNIDVSSLSLDLLLIYYCLLDMYEGGDIYYVYDHCCPFFAYLRTHASKINNGHPLLKAFLKSLEAPYLEDCCDECSNNMVLDPKDYENYYENDYENDSFFTSPMESFTSPMDSLDSLSEENVTSFIDTNLKEICLLDESELGVLFSGFLGQTVSVKQWYLDCARMMTINLVFTEDSLILVLFLCPECIKDIGPDVEGYHPDPCLENSHYCRSDYIFNVIIVPPAPKQTTETWINALDFFSDFLKPNSKITNSEAFDFKFYSVYILQENLKLKWLPLSKIEDDDSIWEAPGF